MAITKWDLLKLSAAFDGDFDESDFSEEELSDMLGLAATEGGIELIREKYFSYHDDVKDRTLDKHKWSD
ncbi:MAG: hypothetical protein LUI60_03440 [Clostridia bacterium]|nr:hypothetical protein [Clostridia bacterium]